MFANVLRSSLRPSDVIARVGGEEFVIVLPDCTEDNARRAFERARAALAEACARGTGPVVTVSAGVATYPESGEDLDTLLRAADTALYAAKSAGRDRMIAARAARLRPPALERPSPASRPERARSAASISTTLRRGATDV